MCLVHRGIMVLLHLFFLSSPFFWAYKGSSPCWIKRGGKAATEAEASQSVACFQPDLCFLGIFSEMDGLIKTEKKLSFTIENILSKYPSSSVDKQSCGTSGLKETKSVHHTCLCCCYCSHCADMFHPDFIHEGIGPSLLKQISSLLYFYLFTLKVFNLLAACQFGWSSAMLSESCRLGDAHKEEQASGQVQRRTRRHRTIFTEEQLDALEELFLQNQYPDVNTREKLAQRTHLREERVEVRLHLV